MIFKFGCGSLDFFFKKSWNFKTHFEAKEKKSSKTTPFSFFSDSSSSFHHFFLVFFSIFPLSSSFFSLLFFSPFLSLSLSSCICFFFHIFI
ncbi:hypothetical protein DFH28DRAFT_969736 [Melampsora americana]|nr:hypothetical protein DFH28DRAFT_969736 [Melampsora americana]